MISATNQACLFRAMINGWRDAQPTGDYSFIFAQSKHSTASAIAQAAALPQPAAVLDAGTKHGSGGFPNDMQAVDSTGVATAADSGEQLARRMALSIITLLFIPVPAFGLYLLLTAYKPQMGKVARIIIAVVGAFVIVMTIALLLTV